METERPNEGPRAQPGRVWSVESGRAGIGMGSGASAPLPALVAPDGHLAKDPKVLSGEVLWFTAESALWEKRRTPV